MKYLIASDLHGSAVHVGKLMDAWEREAADGMILLGDILYHGPRNALPDDYDTRKVIDMLNPLAYKITAVRGNCDAEVDQQLLEFPIMSDYAVLDAGRDTFFLTHGHIWNECRLPPLGTGTVLAHGHTHVSEIRKLPCGITIFNPGSVSLPKGGTSRSYGYYDGSELRIYTI